MRPTLYEVVVVGGGPAGLSAALVLGRCRRRVLVCDEGRPRNVASPHSHGFLTRDGVPPAELLKLGRAELRPYGVKWKKCRVVKAQRRLDDFLLVCADGTRILTRKLVLATGVVDRVPNILGIGPLYGRSVFHCPYCDGWEVRDRRLAAFGRGEPAVEMAIGLHTWSDDVVLFTHGARLSTSQRQRLHAAGVDVETAAVERLTGTGAQLEAVQLQGGRTVERDALFFHTGVSQASPLAESLGCDFTPLGCVQTGKGQSTSVPGLFVVGDAARDVQFIVVAAAEGAKAALYLNRELRREDTAQRVRRAVSARPKPSRSTRL